MGRTLSGIVTSQSGDKTIVITAVVRKTHPLYKKQYSVRTKYMAHDAQNAAKLGDSVIISETRPSSARKRFSLLKIVQRGGVSFRQSDVEPDVEAVLEGPPAANASAKKAKP